MSQSLKILLDARMVNNSMHGIGRYTVNLARGLAQRGHSVFIISTTPETQEVIGSQFITGVMPFLIPYANPGESIELGWRVNRVSDRYDIIHFPSFAVPVVAPLNSVITIHDMIHLHEPATRMHQLYYNTVVKRALDRCAKVITVSNWSKREIIKYLGTPEGKITVVRNGLEPRWFENHSRDKRGQPLTHPFFLCLSNPKRHKNVKTLLAACNQLWNHGHVFELALSLGGAELPADWPIEVRYRPKIHLLRNLGDEQLLPYFLHCKALVSPSFAEGYNYPAAEALAVGRPVILADVSAHPEFEGNIQLYRPADNVPALASAMLKALTIEDDGPVLPHNLLTTDQMVAATLDVYSSALGRG